jgi:hypothetical protein
MNTISDSLIEKLEELYPKPKPEPVKEEPVVAETTVPEYTITTGAITSGHNYASGAYTIQSANAGITLPATWGNLTYNENHLMINTAGNTYPLPIYVQQIAEQNSDTRVTVLDRMTVKESTYSGNIIGFKQYIDDKMLGLEYRLRDHIRQEIDKLKCSPGTPT